MPSIIFFNWVINSLKTNTLLANFDVSYHRLSFELRIHLLLLDMTFTKGSVPRHARVDTGRYDYFPLVSLIYIIKYLAK